MNETVCVCVCVDLSCNDRSPDELRGGAGDDIPTVHRGVPGGGGGPSPPVLPASLTLTSKHRHFDRLSSCWDAYDIICTCTASSMAVEIDSVKVTETFVDS